VAGARLLDELAADLGVFRAAARAAGRDPDTLPVVLRGDAVPDAVPGAGAGRPLFRGTPAQWAEDAERVRELGVGELVLQVAAPVVPALEALHRLREKVSA
jgi:hypothetical protein